MDTTQQAQGDEGRPERPPAPPRPVNLVVVAAALVLIGLVAFALYRRGHPTAPVSPAAPSASPTAGPPAEKPEKGVQIAAPLPVHLTPEAAIVAERYRCVCSCNDPLNVCTCSKTPGSRDMRLYVQQLVDQKKTPHEIDTAMVAKYGSSVLIGGSAPTPSPTPARRRR